MSIYFGNDTVNDLYIGLTPVTKGYVGTHLFYNGDNTIIDLTYEKYILNTQSSTLYNTAEKPVKSAILKGNTLENLTYGVQLPITQKSVEFQVKGMESGKKYTIFYDVEATSSTNLPKIGIVGKAKENGLANWLIYQSNIPLGTGKVVLTMPSFYSISVLKIHKNDSLDEPITLNNLMLLEGDYTNVDILFFDGIQSVKIPGLTTSNEDGTKTNILTVNEDVELRGIGEVKDELDCLTGEVTERVGEIVLDGSQTLQPHSFNQGDTLMVKISDPSISFKQNSSLQESWDFSDMICDKELIAETPKWNVYEWNKGYNIALISSAKSHIYDINSFVLAIRKSYFNVQSIDDFKTWLTQNPLTIQYKLAKESIKTVDLSIVNQDGNDTNLSTFNDITHVMVSSGGLIPVVELEVATKNEEVLNTMSLEMDNISTTQNTLEETSNAQSENVDATMIATTEIYEQLL